MRTHKLKGVKSQAGEVNESNVLGRVVLALERSSNSSSLAVAISSGAEASPVFTDLGFFSGGARNPDFYWKYPDI